MALFIIWLPLCSLSPPLKIFQLTKRSRGSWASPPCGTPGPRRRSRRVVISLYGSNIKARISNIIITPSCMTLCEDVQRSVCPCDKIRCRAVRLLSRLMSKPDSFGFLTQPIKGRKPIKRSRWMRACVRATPSMCLLKLTRTLYVSVKSSGKNYETAVAVFFVVVFFKPSDVLCCNYCDDQSCECVCFFLIASDTNTR